MKQNQLGLMTLGLFALGAIGCSLQGGADRTPLASPARAADNATVAIDKPVAPFALTNYDGKTMTVGDWGSNGRKATVVMFISTRCPVSAAYNTRMEALAKGYSDKGVRFIGINANSTEPIAEVAEHARQHNFSFPVLKDTGNVIADRFEARVTPHVYVIDANGNLRYRGRIDDSQDEAGIKEKDLQAALDAILAGKPVPVKETIAFGCGIKRVK